MSETRAHRTERTLQPVPEKRRSKSLDVSYKSETHDNRHRKWDKISRKGVDEVLKDRPDDFWRYVQHGIPQEHRWRVWKSNVLLANSIICSREDQEREENLFSDLLGVGHRASLLARESAWDKEIRCDVLRTFPELASFTWKHERSLHRVLNVYAFLHPEVGYQAGMGFIVGTFLLASDCSEEESLWLFVRLMESCGLKGFFQKDRSMLKQYEGTFNQLLGELLPNLKVHFDNEGILSSDYTETWFLSLFAYCLPMETALVVYDIIMCKGLPHMVVVALALLKSVQELLLAKGREEILDFFASLNDDKEEVMAGQMARCLSREISSFSRMTTVQNLVSKLLCPVSKLLGLESERYEASKKGKELRDQEHIRDAIRKATATGHHNNVSAGEPEGEPDEPSMEGEPEGEPGTFAIVHKAGLLGLSILVDGWFDA